MASTRQSAILRFQPAFELATRVLLALTSEVTTIRCRRVCVIALAPRSLTGPRCVGKRHCAHRSPDADPAGEP